MYGVSLHTIIKKTSSKNKHCITNYTHTTLIFESQEHDCNSTFYHIISNTYSQ